jgi:hypothetical protein
MNLSVGICQDKNRIVEIRSLNVAEVARVVVISAG